MAETGGLSFCDGLCTNGFRAAAKFFSRVYDVIVVAVFKHTFGDAGRCMFSVCKYANLLLPLDQRPIEFMPRSPGERNNVHIVVRE